MQILKAYRKPDSIVYIIYLPYVITKGKVKTQMQSYYLVTSVVNTDSVVL